MSRLLATVVAILCLLPATLAATDVAADPVSSVPDQPNTILATYKGMPDNHPEAAKNITFSHREPSANRASNIRVISNDRGGELIHYAQMVSRARIDNTLVRFSGTCASSCTLFLSLDASQTCITRGASFLFHRAHSARAGMNQWGSEYLESEYPVWVRNWLDSRGGLSRQTMRMNYSYAAQFIPPCASA